MLLLPISSFMAAVIGLVFKGNGCDYAQAGRKSALRSVRQRCS